MNKLYLPLCCACLLLTSCIKPLQKSNQSYIYNDGDVSVFIKNDIPVVKTISKGELITNLKNGKWVIYVDPGSGRDKWLTLKYGDDFLLLAMKGKFFSYCTKKYKTAVDWSVFSPESQKYLYTIAKAWLKTKE